MMSLKDIILTEVQKGLEKQNLKAGLEFLDNILVITIKADDVKKILLQGFQEPIKEAVQIECGDIKIKVKVM